MSARLATPDHGGLRVSIAAAIVLVFVGLALEREPHTVSARLDDQVVPLPNQEVPCRLRERDALAHAESLEQLAAARWQRVPFALREAPRAALQMAEAESCYAAANEHVGRLRSAAALRAYRAEIERRFARARLALRTALSRPRVDDTPAGESEARQQVETLLALLERAPSSAATYRRELLRLSLRYSAAAEARLRPQVEARLGRASDEEEDNR